MRASVAIPCLVLLAGCASPALQLPFGARPTAVAAVAEPAPVVTEDPPADVPRPRARPERAGTASGGPSAGAAPSAAAAPAAAGSSGGQLGQTLAGLGAPGEPGLWLRTGLVDRVRQGRIRTEAGAVLDVELRPSGGAAGAGSQISLAAMQALRLPLTQLVPLTVSAR